MARVVVTEAATRDLEELVRTHRLPGDTSARVARSLLSLEQFPELGAQLTGSFAPRRFVLGPWRWMIVVYRYYADRDLVAILAIVDGRMSSSPIMNR